MSIIAKKPVNMQKPSLTALLWLASMLLSVSAGAAEPFTLSTALEDTKLYFTAPLRWDEQDWLYFAGSLAAIGAAHEFDQRVRTHFATGSYAVLDGKDRNSLRDAAPAVALIGVLSFSVQ